MGADAFVSSEEIAKTVLWELHRLNNSVVVQTGSAGAESAASTTANAFNFTEKAAPLVK